MTNSKDKGELGSNRVLKEENERIEQNKRKEEKDPMVVAFGRITPPCYSRQVT
jgi:hypothetical protein